MLGDRAVCLSQPGFGCADLAFANTSPSCVHAAMWLQLAAAEGCSCSGGFDAAQEEVGLGWARSRRTRHVCMQLSVCFSYQEIVCMPCLCCRFALGARWFSLQWHSLSSGYRHVLVEEPAFMSARKLLLQ
jgi:hypothetical protein